MLIEGQKNSNEGIIILVDFIENIINKKEEKNFENSEN